MISPPYSLFVVPTRSPEPRYRFPSFANATNPEIGLMFECDAAQWSYGVVRLSAAESTVLLDDREGEFAE